MGLGQVLSSLVFKAKEWVYDFTYILIYSAIWLKRNRTHGLVITFIQLSCIQSSVINVNFTRR